MIIFIYLCRVNIISTIMKTLKNLILISILFFASAMSVSAKNDNSGKLSSYVEPRIGTAHCRYFHFAPGALPFGMAKPGPSTNGHYGNADGWQATGYDYRDKSIEGFPCTHEFQVGGISLMPTTGKLFTVPGDTLMTKNRQGYRSRFNHKDEVATAGYYSVKLLDYGIKAEVTATERVAFQRYTFPSSKQSHIIFDIGNRQGESGAVKDAEVKINADGSIEGWVVTLPEYVKNYQPGANVPIYFYAVADKKATACGTFIASDIKENTRQAQGQGAGAYLTFPTRKGEKVTVKVGISYTSVANARLNLEKEASNLTFDQARQASAQQWEEMLGRVKVETNIHADKVKFYTGLYHAILGRGVCSDINGAYPKHDGSIGQIPLDGGVPRFKMYNTDAMWGGQWNLTQLWLMAYPEHMSQFISSHLQMYKDSGWLADGIANCRFVSGVGTNQLTNMIVAAYMCGVRDFDINLAYEACRKNELDGDNRPRGAGKSDTDKFLQYGYVPHDMAKDKEFQFSASHTLEYSYSAYALALMAKELGKADDYERLMWLSKGWERIYDKKANFMHPKDAKGEFIGDFDPLQVWRGFQEGNAWQYTFYVPHDAKSLVDKVGAEEFTNRLDSIFTLSQKKIFSGGAEVDAFAGLRTLYNQGNQPCLHISWLFNEAGKPSHTQKWVRAILNEFYGTEGIHGYGYGQDEDQGQLGAWYAISSIGLFDVKGLDDAKPSFSLGSTIFDKVTIKLNPKYYKGNEFVIKSVNNSPENIYVQKYKLNGNPLHDIRLPFSVFQQGGTLEMEMCAMPVDRY